MKKRVVMVMLSVMLAVNSLTACGDSSGKEDAVEIGLSENKLKLAVGEEAVLEIDNYDDLRKLDYEIEDEDIVEVEETDDGEYTVTALSEGKTTITFQAKDAEEVTVKVTVEAGEMAVEEAPAAEATEILLSNTELTLDLEDHDGELTITNWSELPESATGSLQVSSTDTNVLEAGLGSNGKIWISLYQEGESTIRVTADGFDPVSCTVYCTKETAQPTESSENTGGESATSVPDTVDYNSDGTVNLWSTNKGKIIATIGTSTEIVDWKIMEDNSRGNLVMFQYNDMFLAMFRVGYPDPLGNYINSDFENDPNSGYIYSNKQEIEIAGYENMNFYVFDFVKTDGKSVGRSMLMIPEDDSFNISFEFYCFAPDTDVSEFDNEFISAVFKDFCVELKD